VSFIAASRESDSVVGTGYCAHPDPAWQSRRAIILRSAAFVSNALSLGRNRQSICFRSCLYWRWRQVLASVTEPERLSLAVVARKRDGAEVRSVQCVLLVQIYFRRPADHFAACNLAHMPHERATLDMRPGANVWSGWLRLLLLQIHGQVPIFRKRRNSLTVRSDSRLVRARCKGTLR
jgi:hypothetical protein